MPAGGGGRGAEDGGCAFAQSALSESQWNLDRLAGPLNKNPGEDGGRISQLDGNFALPGCLCGRGVHLFILDTGRVHLVSCPCPPRYSFQFKPEVNAHCVLREVGRITRCECAGALLTIRRRAARGCRAPLWSLGRCVRCLFPICHRYKTFIL